MDNEKIKSELLWIICGDDKMGATWGSIENMLFKKLNDSEKTIAKALLVELIDSAADWLNDSNADWIRLVDKEAMIPICQANAIGACGILNISEAIPKIVTLFKRRRDDVLDQERYPLYSAIGKLKIRELLPYIEEDLKGIEWLTRNALARNDHVRVEEVTGVSRSAFSALMKIDLDKAIEYAKKYALTINHELDGRLPLVVSAFYAKYKEDAGTYLNVMLDDKVSMAAGRYNEYVWYRGENKGEDSA